MDKNITDKKRNVVIFCAVLIALKKPNIILLLDVKVSMILNMNLFLMSK